MLPPDPASVRALLVRANNWIGDVVLASPALHALRAHYAGARISVLARPRVLAALEGSEDLDEIIVFDDRGRHRGLAGRMLLIAQLRRRRFDLAVLFQKAFEAAALAAAAGARRRFGYATDRRGWLLTDPLAETDEIRSRHHAQVFLDLAAAAGAPAEDLALRFPLDARDRERARQELARAGIAETDPLVAVHPGASKTPRAWHPERFGQLAREAAKLVSGRVVVLGSAADAPLARIILDVSGALGVDLTGRTNVREMAAVCERSALFLGSDSGPMHVAAAVGTPVVAIFGPGRPEKTAPFVPPGRCSVLTRRFPCSPCRQDFFKECEPAPSGKPYCLEEIPVAEALEAVREMLARAEGGPAGAALPFSSLHVAQAAVVADGSRDS